jgi:glycosyltransferase involved in cell wall biosynthesis
VRVISAQAQNVSSGTTGRTITGPSVTVLLPTRNRAGLLNRALESVAAQTCPPSEVIVIDDGSTDDTPDILSRWAEQLPLRVIRHGSPAGPAGARNRGIESARGDLIAFLDDDDEWLPRMLETQVALLRNRSFDVAFAPYLLVGQGGRERTIRVPDEHRKGTLPRLLKGNFIALPTVVARRQALCRSGGFNSALGILVDWELWIRLSHEKSFVCAAEPLARIHQLPASVSSRHDARLHACRIIEQVVQQRVGRDPQLLGDALYSLGMELVLRGMAVPGRDYLRRSIALRPWPPRRIAMTAAAHVCVPLCATLAGAYERLRQIPSAVLARTD